MTDNRKVTGEVTEVVWRDDAVELDKPKSAYELSKSLKKVIVENNLFTNIKGKNYVNVEGWQLAGAFTGIFPKVKSVERVMADTDEIKYRAEVSLFNIKDGKTVGYGVAFCSGKEYSKRNFDEYAIASMAQTRAVSKAYRLTLGWLMKLAGYEATPADEMPDDSKPQPKVMTQKDVSEKMEAIDNKIVITPTGELSPPSIKQLAWLKTYYRQYMGMTDENAEAKAKSFTTATGAAQEIKRLAAEGKL